jgi:hypothetical protein
MSDHTAALCATYHITVTYIRRQAHYLAERVFDGRRVHATGATADEAVARVLSQNTARPHS